MAESSGRRAREKGEKGWAVLVDYYYHYHSRNQCHTIRPAGDSRVKDSDYIALKQGRLHHEFMYR